MISSLFFRTLCLVVILVSACGASLQGQGYTLDEGSKPVDIYYSPETGGEQKIVGQLNYKVVLPNGNRVGVSIDSFSFEGEEMAELILSVHLQFDRPKRKQIRDLRVIFSEEAFNSMRGRFWRVDQSRGRVYDLALKHDDRLTMYFNYPKNGTVNFNLPFVVAPVKWVSDSWTLPDKRSPRNRILGRQIKVLDLMTDEERLWRKSKGRFEGVATYLRKYKQGSHAREAGAFFTPYVNNAYDELVASGRVADGPEQFIDRFTPYDDFSLVRALLQQARRVIENRNKVVARPPKNRKARAPRKTRRRSIAKVTPVEPTAPKSSGGDRSCIVSEGDDGELIVELKGFENPAYYDIYGGLLEIDDSQLKEDTILRIWQIKQGTVNFLVIERNDPSKYVAIPLYNLMKLNINQDNSYEQYDFNISGGVKPYAVYLKPIDGQETSWAMDDIKDQEFSIPFWELQVAGLTGRYQIGVSSEGATEPVYYKSNLIVPDSNYRPWIKPLLIGFGLGGFALLLLYILRRSGQGRRRRQSVRA